MVCSIGNPIQAYEIYFPDHFSISNQGEDMFTILLQNPKFLYVKKNHRFFLLNKDYIISHKEDVFELQTTAEPYTVIGKIFPKVQYQLKKIYNSEFRMI